MRVLWLGALVFGASSVPADADILRASGASCHWPAINWDLPDALIPCRGIPPRADDGTLQSAGAKPLDEAGQSKDEADTTAESDETAGADEQAERRLVAAFEDADAGRLRAALREVQGLVLRAKPDALQRLEVLTRARRGVELPEWLARLRVDAELSAARGRVVRIPYATSYEAPALGRLLQTEADERLAHAFAGRTLREWLSGDEEYTELSADASQMASELRLVAGFLGARLRHDPALRTDRVDRARVQRARDRATRLVAQISDLPGFTSLGTIDDPTLSSPRPTTSPASTPTGRGRPAPPPAPAAPASAPVVPETVGPG